ncbi:MAG: hypothetical protein IJ091_05120 [Oscillospiraceae bacterium]|nr:hypothetical protein [Oscillospiraceae bacterium]
MINYLESKTLAQDQRFYNDIQVFDFGGNEELSNFLMNLKNMDRFDLVTSLAVLRDAEKDYKKACWDVSSTLKKCGFVSSDSSGTWVSDGTTGLKVGFMLFPLNNTAGTLEDLCLQILSEKNSNTILSTIDAFLDTMELTYGRNFARKHKNKLHTYLSSSNEYVTMPLGLASSCGAFDWESDKLVPLKLFLSEGFGITGK